MAETKRILITGASGFVGGALTRSLLERGVQVRMTGRARALGLEGLGAEWFAMPDLSREVDWFPALEGMDGVVHLAGLAHRAGSLVPADQALYDQVNHQATRSLARALRGHPSVRRFAFISTIRVHGDPERLPVSRDSPLAPATPYDRSKADAEAAVREWLGAETWPWAILRPALVYGPGNRGNMALLEGLLRRGIPVPAGRHENRRSFVYLGNLVSAIEKFMLTPDPPSGRTWIVADGQVISTERLVRAMAEAMGLRARVVRFPRPVLCLAARAGDLCRRLGVPVPWSTETQHKLLGDFYADTGAIEAELGWVPPFDLQQGLGLTYKR